MTRTNILTLVPDFPLPTHSGYNLRNWYLIRHLARYAEVTMLCRCREPVADRYLSECDQAGIRLRLCYEPAPRPWVKGTKGLSFLLQPYPFAAAGWYFPRIARQLARMLSGQHFHAVILESVLLCSYWPIIRRSSALKILDLHNLEAELFHRQARLARGFLEKILYYHETTKMERIENRLIREADLVFVTSERERSLLKGKGIRNDAQVVANGVDCERLRPLGPPSSTNLLFVGTMDYLPNENAVVHFAGKVFPALRERIPSIRFIIVGRNPTARVRKLGEREGIVVTGEVPDLTAYYRDCAVVVVPLQAGGGTRLKILEAMAYGRPIVSTSVGCEGIACRDGEHLLIANNASQMADAIQRLLSQPELVTRLVTTARRLVEDRYDWSRIVKRVHLNICTEMERKRKE